MAIVHAEESAILRGCFFDVQNDVGLGRQEQAYHRACELWLEAHDIPFRSKSPHHLRLGNEVAHSLIPDLAIWNSIIVELKAIRRRLQEPEFVQIFDYLKCRGLSFAIAPVSKAFFRGVEVDESHLDCLVIDNRIVLTVSALLDQNAINISRGKSYVRALGLQWGIGVNFGKRMVPISGFDARK